MKKILLALLSGVIYALAFPSYNLWPAVFIFAVPLLIAAAESTPREAFVYGLISGLVARAGNLYWIAFVMERYGGMHLGLAAMMLSLLLLYLALYFAVFAWLFARLKNIRGSFIILAGLWTGLEIFGTYLPFNGFPWNLAGHPLINWLSLAQTAEFGGVYLLSAIVIMTNIAIWQLLRKEMLPVLICIVLLACGSFWGDWRMQNLAPNGETFRAAIAQANINQDEKWLPHMIEPTIDIYTELSRQAAEQGARLVVWPETSCNFFLFRSWAPTMQILDFSKETPAMLLVGSPFLENRKYFNRMWLLENGSIRGHYDKVHLVPFGEYLPLAWLLHPILGELSDSIGDFSRNGHTEPIDDIGVLICFESLFPDISRALCRQGATFLTNVSNDAWFKTWATPEQLLNMSAFRAIENRRWLLRSVNHGISAAIMPSGKVAASIGLLQEGCIVEEITKNRRLTFYTCYGPLISGLWALLALIATLTKLRRSANPCGHD